MMGEAALLTGDGGCLNPSDLRRDLGIHYKGSSCFTGDVEKCVVMAQNQAPPTISSGSLITQFNARQRSTPKSCL